MWLESPISAVNPCRLLLIITTFQNNINNFNPHRQIHRPCGWLSVQLSAPGMGSTQHHENPHRTHQPPHTGTHHWLPAQDSISASFEFVRASPVEQTSQPPRQEPVKSCVADRCGAEGRLFTTHREPVGAASRRKVAPKRMNRGI